METINIEKDIKVMYVTAASFPDGIQDAFELLRKTIPVYDNRRVFGISRPEGNDIIYRAGVEELKDDEAEHYGCKALVLRKGNYISMVVHNYAEDISSINAAFDQLLHQQGLDPKGYCVEVYNNETDVLCMVRLEA